MRFVFYSLALMLAISSPSNLMAAPGDEYTLPKIDQSAQTPRTETDFQHATASLQKQVRSATSKLKVSNAFTLSEIATGLGSISAMIEDDKGNLLILDKKRGRLYRLIDRARDGKIDNRIPYAAAFKKPSGLTRKGEDIYIADLNGIWKISSDGTAQFALSLSNANISETLPRPLFYDQYRNRLLLGLNRTQSQSQKPAALIEIDIKTKRASIIEEFDAPITHITQSVSQDIWISTGDKLRQLGKQSSYPLEAGVQIGGFVLPQNALPEDWPLSTKDHIIVSQSTPSLGDSEANLAHKTSGGVNIVSLPTVFGTPQNKIIVMADGFLSKRGHAAWGKPGPLLLTQNGLYISDSWQGSLWRIIPAKPLPSPKQPRLPKSAPDKDDQTEIELAQDKQKQNTDSQFKSRITASQITGSNIQQGSTLNDTSISLVEKLQEKTDETVPEINTETE